MAAVITLCMAVGGTSGAAGDASGAAQRCANASITPTSSNLRLVETATLCLINVQRGLHGERPLRNNRGLDRAARAHSLDMVRDNYFAHTTPGGETFLERLRACGYLRHALAYELGENIAAATLWLATPTEVVGAWMNSPPHRANILDPDFVDSGIGVVAAVPARYAAGEGGATYTQDFGVVELRKR